ncbi:MAG TPA: ABC transporter permease [Pyrinomonadaceae bacterium]|nr:ABC transporter permease [Pyrinomonadaceae bacterium]
METLLRDIRYGVRSLAKRPGFTAIALIALALGIGANTAIFTLVNAVLLRPLPFAEPDRLVWVWGNVKGGTNRASVSPLDFLDFRQQNTTFEEFAASFSMPLSLNLTGNGEPERLQAAGVTGNYFQALGVKPELGRTFLLENEKPGNDQVVVLSHRLWQKRFGGSSDIVNKTVTLGGKSCLVLGVMSQDFSFPQFAELWVPMNFDVEPGMKQRKAHFLRPIGRLKPGVTMAQAQADTDAIARHLEEQYPESNKSWNLRLVSLREQLVGNTRPTLFILFGAVGFVLLIACANVANLLLVRAAGRQKEIALRTALGAGRFQIVRQMITESVVLALLGGILGVILATWGVELLVSLSEGSIPPTARVKIDATVLGFTLLISIVTGVLFGLVPALRTLKVNLTDSLKEGGRSASEGVHRNRTRSILVVLESAVAVVLLIGAGLLIRSLIQLQNISPGFDAHNVLTMRVDLSREKYDTPEKSRNFFSQLESRLAGLPGVEKVGFISELPLSGQPNDMPYTVEGRPPVSIDQAFDDDFRRVNRHYFEAMRIPFLRGRNFTDQEVSQSAKVVIISDLLAQRTFPNEDPLGKRLIMAMGNEPFEIIGIVGDIRHRALESAPLPAMYLPTYQPGTNIVIRTKGDPTALAAAARKEVQGLDPDQPVAAVKTMEQWLEAAVAAPRYRTSLIALFALVALILACTGIYGVMSYSVTQRTHEIGVRMALGARRFDVLKLVVRQGMTLVVVGVLLGVAGAIGLTRVMSSLLFGVTAKDPLTFVAVASVLTVVAFIACYLPARRATKVDPLVALRYE